MWGESFLRVLSFGVGFKGKPKAKPKSILRGPPKLRNKPMWKYVQIHVSSRAKVYSAPRAHSGWEG